MNAPIRTYRPPAADTQNHRSSATTRVAPFAHLHIGSFANFPHHSSPITHNSHHSFSAKERDVETGLSYFGSRYYSADLSIWLSVDPMSGKYPSFSSYVYCADNPVRCVDPNGEEIVLKGEDGDYTYKPGDQCKSSDKNVQDAWENLNKMYETKAGKGVIDEMTAEESPIFTITNESLHNDATGRFKPDGKKGGTLYMGGKMKEAEYVAHELFHGYQEMKGQGGCSIHNEVEANLFSMITTQISKALAPINNNLITDYGKVFTAFNLSGKITKSNFDTFFGDLCDGFINQSVANFNQAYSGYPSGEGNISLLKQFFD